MTKIANRTLVHAPLASAKSLIEAVFSAHTPAGADDARFILRAGENKHPAVVQVANARQVGDMTPRYAIHWSAESGGPYPVFEGQLIVEADEVYECFWLAMAGGYVPPGGAVGALFDIVAGRRIADSTAQAFLEELRRQIEFTFADREHAKVNVIAAAAKPDISP
jgi:hypothetical protein